MWILALQDKLYWLIRGQTYTIGRNSAPKNNDGYIGVTNDASVSRQHITIEVRSTSPDCAMHPSVRSELVITDLNSRFGTKVEGTVLEPGSPYVLPHSSTGMGSIKLGSRTKIRLLWQTFVITYSTGQSGQSHDTLWQHAFDTLEPLDVKLMPYIVKSTNLFVKTGKATTSLYYALTKQIPVVNNHYFTALQTSAEEISRNGTLSSSVIPSFEPFLPEPRWAPNKGRATCFANLSFHVPASDFAKAIEPILESAGGNCVPSEAAKRLNAIYIYSCNAAIVKPRGIRFALDTAVFNALEECRSLKENEIQESSMDGAAMSKPVPSARRSKLNILNIMTTQTSQRANELTPTKNTSQEADSPNTSDADITMAEGPSAAGGSKRRISASAQHPENKKPAVTSRKTPLEVVANQSRSRGNLRGKKRAPEAQLQKVPTKRKATETDEGHSDLELISGEEEEKELEEDIAFQNYEDVEELAIVEFSVETMRKPATTKTTNSVHATFGDRPNYKAFKRFGNVVGKSKFTKAEYAYEAVNVKHDFCDEMLIDDEDETVSSRNDVPNIDSSGLVSMSRSNISTVSEEQLFVGTEDEGGMDTMDESNFNGSGDASLEQQELMRMQSSPRPVDEFDFSFS